MATGHQRLLCRHALSPGHDVLRTTRVTRPWRKQKELRPGGHRRLGPREGAGQWAEREHLQQSSPKRCKGYFTSLGAGLLEMFSFSPLTRSLTRAKATMTAWSQLLLLSPRPSDACRTQNVMTGRKSMSAQQSLMARRHFLITSALVGTAGIVIPG